MRIPLTAAALAAALIFASAPGTSSVTAGPASDTPERPYLLVLIAVDQMIPAYFDRYGAEFTGALGHLYRNGVVFTNARQDHAVTETGPGHSTMLSGRAPASTGIVTNNLGAGDSAHGLIGTAGPGASPWRFRGTALYDWLVAADSGAAVLSVSRKDRGAIFPVGRAGNDVYWYRNGQFTTSSWYRRELPPWLQRWNARNGAARLIGMEWTTLREASQYPEPDSVPYENGGVDVAFPHRLPGDSTALAQLVHFPWIDSLTLDVAIDGVKSTGLGARGRTDLLVMSLTGTDEVGHDYGPESREIHDQLLRLDLWLGRFLDSLATMVPRSRTIVTLTADHGMTPFPEGTSTAGRVSLAPVVRDLVRQHEPRYHTRFAFDASSGLISADVAALRSRGVNVDSLSRALALRLAGLPGVATVYTPADLTARARTSDDARLWRRTLPADFGWLAAASLKPGWIWAGGTLDAEHGSTSLADTHVPLIFLRPGLRGARIARVVTTEDIGPTLAALAGVRPTEPVTGRVLTEVTGTRK